MGSEAAQHQIELLQAQLDRWNFTPYANGVKQESDVAAVESELGRRLPEDFRWFCVTYGNGHTRRHSLAIQLEVPSGESLKPGMDVDLVEFDRIGNVHTLQDNRELYGSAEFPDGLVPCASTNLGEMFFIRLDEAHDGTVWFWASLQGGDPANSLFRAADSFTDLLAASHHVIAKTERLTLRSFERADSAALFEIHGSPETMELMPRGLLQDEPAAAALIDERRSQHHEIGYSTWAVVLRSTGRLIGSCGFRPSEEGGPFELGYVIDHNYWGQGYATEAATAAINHIFDNHVVPGSESTVFATIRPNNEPSIAVARRLGMQQVESTADEHGELLQFELDNQ